MPSRNALKQFETDMSYHCYNRGVEKRTIFVDDQDYGVFLNRLKQMLADPETLKAEFKKRELVKSFFGRIELRSYCLMPNHFHLLLYQHDEEAIADFMRTLSTSYAMYFNKRYERVGHLYQGRYKARRIDSDEYSLHISRYIHLNPQNLEGGYKRYPYSSMRFLLEPDMCPAWLHVDKVLIEHDGLIERYTKFVDEYAAVTTLDEMDDQYDLN